eukprot:s329_g7.t1
MRALVLVQMYIASCSLFFRQHRALTSEPFAKGNGVPANTGKNRAQRWHFCLTFKARTFISRDAIPVYIKLLQRRRQE